MLLLLLLLLKHEWLMAYLPDLRRSELTSTFYSFTDMVGALTFFAVIYIFPLVISASCLPDQHV